MTFLIYGGEFVPNEKDFESILDNSARSMIYNMQHDDVEILLENIRKNIEEFNSHETTQSFRSKRMADGKEFFASKLADDGSPKVRMEPSNMTVIEEEDPLVIECNVYTSDSATVLLKHNGEIVHEWHIS